LGHTDVSPIGIVPVLEVAVNHFGSGRALEADAAVVELLDRFLVRFLLAAVSSTINGPLSVVRRRRSENRRPIESSTAGARSNTAESRATEAAAGEGTAARMTAAARSVAAAMQW
jgi:hypothetical protein